MRGPFRRQTFSEISSQVTISDQTPHHSAIISPWYVASSYNLQHRLIGVGMATNISVPSRLAFAAVMMITALGLLASKVGAADPDPLQDFCVADLKSSLHINGFPCKATVTSEDFTFRGLRKQGNLRTSFGAPLQKAFVAQFPGINSQGIAWARLDFAYPGGLNVPHWHQRATEILSCQEGELLVGFVDTNNTLWSSVLQKGDITVFPRGLMHFQLNVGKTPAYAVLALNSQNAGRSDVGASTFGAGVKEQILEKAFNLSREAVVVLEQFFHSLSSASAEHESLTGLEVM